MRGRFILHRLFHSQDDSESRTKPLQCWKFPVREQIGVSFARGFKNKRGADEQIGRTPERLISFSAVNKTSQNDEKFHSASGSGLVL